MVPGPELALGVRVRLPDALRVLVDAYPRATWESHANFGQLVQFWMQRHAMFRQLVQVLRDDAQGFVNQQIAFQDYAPRLSQYAGTLLNELHGHHQIEDQHYFPQLVALDKRVAKGFDLLESDHLAMDGLLHGLATGANTVLQGGPGAPFLDRLEDFATLLERHLIDEEEIIVPVILHTGFRG
ncbi:MAG: hemerythrin domain-containing protein [Roseobacter sp.]